MRRERDQRIALCHRPVGVERRPGCPRSSRRRADRHARDSGSQLSASTASTPATSAAGSSTAAPNSRLSQWVTIIRLARRVDQDRRERVESRPRSADDAGAVDALARESRRACARRSSASAGPPSVAASRARPPSRAIAIAALAAQPPTDREEIAAPGSCPAAPGTARRGTPRRAPPCRRTGWCARRALAECNLVLDPGADDVMRDGDGRRRAEAVGMACAAASAPPRRGRTSARPRARCGRS